MRKENLSLAAISLAVLLAAGGCEEGERAELLSSETLEPVALGEIATLHARGDVLLASQPTPADFEKLKSDGVRTVVNLRPHEENEEFDEEAVVTNLGMSYVNLPWNGAEQLTDEIFDRSRELLNEAEKPVLLHCSSSNRVGAVWIPWRVLDGGIEIEDAVNEGRKAGLKSDEYEAKARDYIRRQRGS